MRRLPLVLVLTSCTSANEPVTQTTSTRELTRQHQVAECRPRRTWAIDQPDMPMAGSECVTNTTAVATERFALCLDAFEPGRVPTGRMPWIADDVWRPACAESVVWPCVRGVACTPTGCTCMCDYDTDCAAPAVARAYAGALPHGVSVACEEHRCAWSTE